MARARAPETQARASDRNTLQPEPQPNSGGSVACKRACARARARGGPPACLPACVRARPRQWTYCRIHAYRGHALARRRAMRGGAPAPSAQSRLETMRRRRHQDSATLKARGTAWHSGIGTHTASMSLPTTAWEWPCAAASPCWDAAGAHHHGPTVSAETPPPRHPHPVLRGRGAHSPPTPPPEPVPPGADGRCSRLQYGASQQRLQDCGGGGRRWRAHSADRSEPPPHAQPSLWPAARFSPTAGGGEVQASRPKERHATFSLARGGLLSAQAKRQAAVLPRLLLSRF